MSDLKVKNDASTANGNKPLAPVATWNRRQVAMISGTATTAFAGGAAVAAVLGGPLVAIAALATVSLVGLATFVAALRTKDTTTTKHVTPPAPQAAKAVTVVKAQPATVKAPVAMKKEVAPTGVWATLKNNPGKVALGVATLAGAGYFAHRAFFNAVPDFCPPSRLADAAGFFNGQCKAAPYTVLDHTKRYAWEVGKFAKQTAQSWANVVPAAVYEDAATLAAGIPNTRIAQGVVGACTATVGAYTATNDAIRGATAFTVAKVAQGLQTAHAYTTQPAAEFLGSELLVSGLFNTHAYKAMANVTAQTGTAVADAAGYVASSRAAGAVSTAAEFAGRHPVLPLAGLTAFAAAILVRARAAAAVVRDAAAAAVVRDVAAPAAAAAAAAGRRPAGYPAKYQMPG